MAVEELFQWGELFKFPVRPLQDGFIGIIQPVTLTFGYGIQSLRIELAVVDGDIRIDGTGDLNADETAAATGIGQQVLLIAGTDEGGIPPHLTDGAAVGFAQVGNRFLQQMLQETLLVDADLVELVDVDEQKASQAALRFLPALEVDAVRIAETQLRWQQNAAKGGFPEPLRTDKQRRSIVSVLPVHSTPVCHHAQEPAVEQLLPMRIVARNEVGQRPDAVFPVPAAGVVKVLFDGIIEWHVV